MNKDLPYFLALSQAPGVGVRRFKVLFEHFKTAQKVWDAPEEILKQLLDKTVFQNFRQFRANIDPRELLEKTQSRGISILALNDNLYPKLLKQIFDPPPVLYVRGQLQEQDSTALAVVGTRRVTTYGKEVTEMLVRDLANYKITIVSGLARGVDALAHRFALENKIRTVAVLGCGVDIIYPAQNKSLAEQIEKNGAIISEYPPGTQPMPGHFPARNRIISGMSLGVLITEADEKSGSLITAASALDQNREVFAVPGPIYSKLSRGPTELIKQGAKLVTKAEDIVDELKTFQRIKSKKAAEIKADSKEEEKILNLLENEEKHIDQLVRESGFASDKLNGLLVTMELSGKIKNLGSGNYSVMH
jgi:DNA processing protein